MISNELKRIMAMVAVVNKHPTIPLPHCYRYEIDDGILLCKADNTVYGKFNLYSADEYKEAIISILEEQVSTYIESKEQLRLKNV